MKMFSTSASNRPPIILKASDDSVLYTYHLSTSSTERADLIRVESDLIKKAMGIIQSEGKHFNNNSNRYYLLKGCVLRYFDNNGNIQVFYETRKSLITLANYLGFPYPKLGRRLASRA